MNKSGIDLTTRLGRIKLKNPILTAAGTFGYGEEYAGFINLNKLGGLITKTVTLNPLRGNPPPRLAETPAGLLNSIGLENPGVEVFVREKLPFLQGLNTAVIVSIGGKSEEEYLKVAEKLQGAEAIKALEVNASCPNLRSGGAMIGKDARLLFSLTSRLKKVSDLPLILKLPPTVENMIDISQAAREGGAEAVSLTNAIPAMAIDVEKRCPRLGNITGGLSGPAIKPVIIKIVWEVSTRVEIPVLGVGGIVNLEDVLEFVLAGASAVEVGTANFIDPGASVKITEELEHYLHEERIKSFSRLIGRLKIKEQ